MRGVVVTKKLRPDDTVSVIDGADSKVIYWHRELPPFHAEAMGEHIVEAASNRVLGTLVNRDEYGTVVTKI